MNSLGIRLNHNCNQEGNVCFGKGTKIRLAAMATPGLVLFIVCSPVQKLAQPVVLMQYGGMCGIP